jgi:hypothetical protein
VSEPGSSGLVYGYREFVGAIVSFAYATPEAMDRASAFADLSSTALCEGRMPRVGCETRVKLGVVNAMLYSPRGDSILEYRFADGRARVGILTPAQFFRSEAEDEPVLSRKGWKRPEYGAAAKSDSLLHHKLSCFQTPTLDARRLYLIGGEQR